MGSFWGGWAGTANTPLSWLRRSQNTNVVPAYGAGSGPRLGSPLRGRDHRQVVRSGHVAADGQDGADARQHRCVGHQNQRTGPPRQRFDRGAGVDLPDHRRRRLTRHVWDDLLAPADEAQQEACEWLDDKGRANGDQDRGDLVRDQDAGAEPEQRPESEDQQAQREGARDRPCVRYRPEALDGDGRPTDANGADQEHQPVEHADAQQGGHLGNHDPDSLRGGQEGAGDRLVAVLRADRHDPDDQGEQVGDAQPCGVDGRDHLGVVEAGQPRPAPAGAPLLSRAGHHQGEEDREQRAGQEHPDRHAPPHPGAEELAELCLDCASHHGVAPSYGADGMVAGGCSPGMAPLPALPARLRLRFSGLSVSSKNRASRSVWFVRSSWIGRPAARAMSPTWAMSSPIASSIVASVAWALMPAAMRALTSAGALVVRTMERFSPCRSATDPCWMSRPLAMMTTSSTVCSTSASIWLEMRIVLPWLLRWRKNIRSHRMPSGSRPLAGSSSRSTWGSPSIAAARASRWRMPME